MGDQHEQLRDDLCRVYIELDRLGLIFLAAGNISVRVDGGMLISPAGCSAETIRPDSFVLVQDGKPVEGQAKPSSEWSMHTSIYERCPEANAIVHTHSDHCVAVAATRRPLPSFHYMVASFGGYDVPCTPYVTFGSPALGIAAANALVDRTACLLGNHGMICHGRTIDKAMATALRLEVLCRQYIAALQAGQIQYLTPEEMQTAVERYKSYGAR
ncbi:class II aldolase/adducin family protein [Shinella daejeonensis]|uniref:class II aldolase/adducin family protein n=1 Tax=Shinella daejeonensis TaxID=659017 RepID=UPI0020C78F22|nr:class II aldolase/adducin family protein [Shinella daejeonensis]MCP8894567.1 class II aldolase/adducin family protein [Shinella daejeonensis]